LRAQKHGALMAEGRVKYGKFKGKQVSWSMGVRGVGCLHRGTVLYTDGEREARGDELS
jgi:hypothetical protein